jgi:hypothetical protein
VVCNNFLFFTYYAMKKIFTKFTNLWSSFEYKGVASSFIVLLITASFILLGVRIINKDDIIADDAQENVESKTLASSDEVKELVVEKESDNFQTREDLEFQTEDVSSEIKEDENDDSNKKDNNSDDDDKDEKDNDKNDEDEKEEDEDSDDEKDEKDDEENESVYSEKDCVEQKKVVAKEADAYYLDWYDDKLEAKEEVGECYSENPVPICDKQMSDFNVEWQEKVNDKMKELQDELTKCPPSDRTFSGYCETAVPSNY